MERSKKLKIVSVALYIIVLVPLIYAVVNRLTIQNIAHVNSPSELTITPNTFHWGTLERGQTYHIMANLTNIGDTDCDNLNMTHDDLSIYGLTYTWDLEHSTLSAHQSVIATFTLSVLNGNFSNGSVDFNIYIGGD
jgi:hypothetical protein